MSAVWVRTIRKEEITSTWQLFLSRYKPQRQLLKCLKHRDCKKGCKRNLVNAEFGGLCTGAAKEEIIQDSGKIIEAIL